MIIYTVSFVILFSWSRLRFIAHFVYVRIAGALFFMALFPDSTRSALPRVFRKVRGPVFQERVCFQRFLR